MRSVPGNLTEEAPLACLFVSLSPFSTENLEFLRPNSIHFWRWCWYALALISRCSSLPFSSKKKSVDPEEEDAEEKVYENSDEEDGNHGVERYGFSSSSVFDFSASHSARDSGLPSTNDVFFQVIITLFLRIHQISRSYWQDSLQELNDFLFWIKIC